jgi:hypothetical protein
MSPARSRSAGSSGETTICQWCSATIPVEAAKCPSCGAQLRDAVAGDIAGVTQVDLAATSKIARLARQKPGRLAGWLGAEQTAEGTDLGGRIEPPSDEVKREMLRLELAAIDAELEAQKAHAEAQKALPPEDAAEANPG